MTREELITIICNDTSSVTCHGNCDLPEKEGNTGDCCRKCAERLLKNYEIDLINTTREMYDARICDLQHEIDILKDKIDDLLRQLDVYECKWSVIEMIFKK